MPGVGAAAHRAGRRRLRPWQRVHDWLAYAVRSPITSGADSHLYYGAPAVAHALACAAAVRPGSYERALDSLDEAIAQDTRGQGRRRARPHRPPTSSPNDMSSNSSAAWPASAPTCCAATRTARTVRAVLEYLVRLTQPIADNGDVVPGWWVPTSPTGRDDDQFPGGHANFGMAHGIAGPLALLALAARHGTIVDGHLDAIDSHPRMAGPMARRHRRRARSGRTGSTAASCTPDPSHLRRTGHRPGATAQPGLPALSNSPPTPGEISPDSATRSKRSSARSPTHHSSPRPRTAVCATDTPDCAHPRSASPPTPRPATPHSCGALAMSLMDRIHPADTDANQTAANLLRCAAGPGLLEGATGIALAALTATDRAAAQRLGHLPAHRHPRRRSNPYEHTMAPGQHRVSGTAQPPRRSPPTTLRPR